MTATADLGAPPPGLARRLAAFLYEGVLLFGVTFFAGFLYSVLTRQQHAMQGRTGLGVFLFFVLGLYFVGFWTRSGQTLAMKTWHLRVVDTAGRPLGWGRALLRYCLGWLWFLPALLSVWALGLHGGVAIFGSLAAGVLAYLLIARLHPQRQFLHDTICGSRVVTQLPQRR
ncbi:RDD family protein [Roseateles saccharophilus]|uniref:Putative RDD family membrane protein YckC n=1 Tax=Roseateles saccharophilus TaxID=304 RepID=A0A4R3V4V4_ROSSA|nr:RDD family protein [Roseateles saccharophilus]MDG0831535.1 RDD family protein [Roseateles saccharophilus]TCU98581.1 putative RDD family membrane protein YckC [Roseateles saccharophilus]